MDLLIIFVAIVIKLVYYVEALIILQIAKSVLPLIIYRIVLVYKYVMEALILKIILKESVMLAIRLVKHAMAQTIATV